MAGQLRPTVAARRRDLGLRQEDRIAEVRSRESSSSEIGPQEVGETEVSVAEVGPDQKRTSK